MLRPEQFLGLPGLDSLTHSLLWSLLANAGLYFVVSLGRAPSAREASQALLFVDVFDAAARCAQRPGLLARPRQGGRPAALAGRFLGPEPAQRAVRRRSARSVGVGRIERIAADAQLVQFVETQLAGAIGSASARVMVASWSRRNRSMTT